MRTPTDCSIFPICNFSIEQNRFDQALVSVKGAGQSKLFDENMRKPLTRLQGLECRKKGCR
jgi:hypothetical protein